MIFEVKCDTTKDGLEVVITISPETVPKEVFFHNENYLQIITISKSLRPLTDLDFKDPILSASQPYSQPYFERAIVTHSELDKLVGFGNPDFIDIADEVLGLTRRIMAKLDEVASPLLATVDNSIIMEAMKERAMWAIVSPSDGSIYLTGEKAGIETTGDDDGVKIYDLNTGETQNAIYLPISSDSLPTGIPFRMGFRHFFQKERLMLKIIKPSDGVELGQFRALIYGPNGCGKTSMGFTAENPFLLDFEDGAKRSKNRRDYAVIKSIPDLREVTATVIAPYSTIIIDPVDKYQEMIKRSIPTELGNIKMKNMAGGLTTNGWQHFKERCIECLEPILQSGKDIIFLAHMRTSEEDGVSSRAPLITGAFSNWLTSNCELVGTIHAGQGQYGRLCMRMSDGEGCKNPGDFQPFVIPHYRDQSPMFLADIIADSKASISRSVEEHNVAMQEIDEARAEINGLQDLEGVNNTLAAVIAMPVSVKQHTMKRFLVNRATELGLVYSRENEGFIESENSNPEGLSDEVSEASE